MRTAHRPNSCHTPAEGRPARRPGCLSPLPITSLKDYALTSALKDRRFSPIDARELPLLHCAVSLLTEFETAGGPHDWEIGTHGVLIGFTDPQVVCPLPS